MRSSRRRAIKDRAGALAGVLATVAARGGSVERGLDDGELSSTEIAFLLGYSEQSAFDRAFPRWFRQSPRDYRASRLLPARRPRPPR